VQHFEKKKKKSYATRRWLYVGLVVHIKKFKVCMNLRHALVVTIYARATNVRALSCARSDISGSFVGFCAQISCELVW
jgi:tRNA G37 N-methylase Trm5